MNIFQSIGKSIYGPDFYASLKTSGTKASIVYYLKLIALLSVLSAIIWGIVFLPKIHDFLSPEFVKKAVELYPADLNLKLKNGEISTDAKLPYIIPVPKDDLEKMSDTDGKVENYVVIDTRVDNFSLGLLDGNKTAVFIGKNFIAGRDDGGAFKVMPLSDYKDYSYELNRASIEALALKALPVVNKVVNFLPFLMLLVFYIAQSAFLISVLLIALIVWLVTIMKKDSHGYKYALRLTIHAATLALIIDAIFGVLSGIPGSGWGTLILVIVIILINTRKEKLPSEPLPATK